MATFEIADSAEMEKRREQAEVLFDCLLSQEERPQFVSDEASLYDVSSDGEAELGARCRRHYGVGLEPYHFQMPIWKLLDYLDKARTIKTYHRSDIAKIYRRT
jgi:hypothetical protein